MVGAGLSANAEPHVSGSKRLPLWKDLHKMLEKALYGNVEDNLTSSADSFLKLAQEFRDYHGAVKLDEFIKSQIDTDAFDPSDYHKELLEIEWVDVFTTNYDDLLERTRVFNRHYSLVKTVQEIASSSRPRIVKLHGSLPSGPFVFTEEDYRIYPKRFAPFVNMVQQAIVETTMCLIGFSGDDPNFLSWIGWVNDNLGKNRNPVFLIGDLHLSQSKRRYLESKFVLPLDFAPVIPEMLHGEDRHRKAVEMFLSYVKHFKVRDDCDWPLMETNGKLPIDWVSVLSVQKEKHRRKLHLSRKDLKNEDLPDLAEELEQERLTYPGWVAIPHKTRMKQIDESINLIYTTARMLADLQKPLDLFLARELLWKLDILLFPLPSELHPLFLAVVKKYDFSSATQAKGRDAIEKIDWSSQNRNGKVFENWIQILLSLMKAARLNGREMEFMEIQNELEPLVKGHLDWEQRWFFEKAMFELHYLKITDLKKTLECWPECGVPIWISRKALLVALYGDVEKAIELSGTAVRHLSSEVHKSTAANSEASFGLCTSRLITLNKTISLRPNQFSPDGTEPIAEMKNIYSDLLPEILSSLEKELEVPGEVTIHFAASVDKAILYASELMLFSEEGAIPMRLRFVTSIGTKESERALEQLVDYFPIYVILKAIQILDDKGIDQLLTSQTLLNLDERELSALAVAVMRYIESASAKLEEHHEIHLTNSLRVLSKICFALGADLVREAAGLLRRVYSRETVKSNSKFPGEEVSLCLGSLIKACDRDAAEEIIKASIILPLPQNGFLDILATAANARPGLMRNTDFSENDFEKLVDMVQDNPRAGIERVETLMYFSKLDKEDYFKRFSQIYWKAVDKSGKPTCLHSFDEVFRIPEPFPGAASECAKKILLSRRIPYIWEKEGNMIRFREKGSSTIFRQFIYSTSFPPNPIKKTPKILWQASDSKQILGSLADWWFAQRENLLGCLSSIEEEKAIQFFERRSLFLVKRVLKRVILPFLEAASEDSWTQINSILLDLKYEGIPILDSIPFFLKLNGREYYVITELENGLLSYDEEAVLSAINGVVEWASFSDVLPPIPNKLLTQLLGVAENRSGRVLRKSIEAITFLYDDLFSEKQYLKDLNAILYRARSSSSVNSKYPKRLIDQAVEIAEAGSALAMKMHQHADARGAEIGQEVAAWKEFSESSIFPSVRNIWKDNY
ncbi:SIR2 family NAD-dependent protein deacylase [Mesotoga sp. UBA5847]|uniref:SIR2 family NAD-dependent protein deacylase n=1 Tax=Mesotoga sp. UBA5847 TaxID=1946859 RepID=UPI0025FA5B87|nr:SIR2 family protein [Mesotoga sp. UBA5847]